MAYNNLGFTYFNQGNLTKAIQLYEKAIELDPDNTLVYNNLGNAYYNSNFDKALIYYKKAARLGDKGIQDWLKRNGHEW
jgi:tetratricopeptide (TPR) repeat protein